MLGLQKIKIYATSHEFTWISNTRNASRGIFIKSLKCGEVDENRNFKFPTIMDHLNCKSHKVQVWRKEQINSRLSFQCHLCIIYVLSNGTAIAIGNIFMATR